MTARGHPPSQGGSTTAAALGPATIRRVRARLLPYLFLLYLLNFLDRTNVGLAALQMNRDLRFSDAAYGLGAGIFFVGYALFEVPSNVILARVGARRWIARIMITWGLVATAMMFVRTPLQFWAMRFLLGVAEAGFFPGIVYYLGQWFPAAERARALAGFMIAIPISASVGSLVGGALLALDGRWGLAGWQWLFLLEGLPSVLVGVTVLRWLTDRPAEAHWLAPEQREWLAARLAAEDAAHAQSAGHTPDATFSALAQPIVWLVAVPYFLLNLIGYVASFWAPTLLREELGATPQMVGVWLGGIGGVVALAMLAVGASADRRGEHALHVAGGAAVAACGLAMAALVPGPATTVGAITLIGVGTTAMLPAYWCLPRTLLRGRAAAAGIALVNSIANVGGLLGPAMVGAVRDATGDTRAAFAVLFVCALGMAASALVVRGRIARLRPAGAVPVVAGAA